MIGFEIRFNKKFLSNQKHNTARTATELEKYSRLLLPLSTSAHLPKQLPSGNVRRRSGSGWKSYFGGHRKGKRDRGAAGKTVAIPNTQTGQPYCLLSANRLSPTALFIPITISYDVLDVREFNHFVGAVLDKP